jgi:enoyl-CoA hydratase
VDAVRTDRQDHVLTVTINRPDARNALDDEVLAGLGAALRDGDADDDVRVIVLTGAGDRAFCAGADLAGAFDQDASILEQHEGRGLLRELFATTDRLGTPLVGRVNGHALAGGLGVALACDVLVAVDDATFGTPEVKVGLWPYMVSALLVEHLGPKRAMELMMTGRRLSAVDARDWGLVNRVVPRQGLDEAVREMTDQLVAAAPLALRWGRQATRTARDMPAAAALPYLHGMLDLNAQSEDVVEGIQAFFARRDPQWRGR